MRKFKFRFAPVLQVRKTREEEALRVLGAAQRAFQQQLNEKMLLIKELEESFTRRERLGEVPVGIDSFQLEQNFITGQKQRILQKDRDIHRAQKKVEQALRVYLAMRRQTKAMETLYDKDLAEFRKTEMKREQKFSDELAIMRDRMKERAA